MAEVSDTSTNKKKAEPVEAAAAQDTEPKGDDPSKKAPEKPDLEAKHTASPDAKLHECAYKPGELKLPATAAKVSDRATAELLKCDLLAGQKDKPEIVKLDPSFNFSSDLFKGPRTADLFQATAFSGLNLNLDYSKMGFDDPNLKYQFPFERNASFPGLSTTQFKGLNYGGWDSFGKCSLNFTEDPLSNLLGGNVDYKLAADGTKVADLKGTVTSSFYETKPQNGGGWRDYLPSWMNSGIETARSWGSGISGIWDTVFSNRGSAALDQAGVIDKAATIDLSGLKEINKDVRAGVVGDRKVFQTKDNVISMSDGPGPHDTRVRTNDGKLEVHQDRLGNVTATNANSDLSVRKNAETGKIEALDKSGKPIATFDDAGDATRFLKHAVTEVVPPGSNLDQKYEEYRAKLAEEIKKDPSKAMLQNKPILIMDGEGRALTVRPDGTRLYTQAGGDTRMVVQHVDEQKRSSPIEVFIKQDKDGKEHFTVGQLGGQQYELSSAEAAKLIANSRFKIGKDGRLEFNEDTSGQNERAHWRHLMEQQQLRLFEGGQIDTKTGTVVLTEPVNPAKPDEERIQAVLTPNAGVVTDTETRLKSDGTPEDHPTRVITVDKGVATIQGYNHETGQPKPEDVIRIDAKQQKVDAWQTPGDERSGVHIDRENVRLYNPDHSSVDINRNGDINARDKDGKSIVETSGEKVSYDGGKTYEQLKKEYVTKQEQQAIQLATALASEISARVASMGSCSNPAELAALEALLGSCLQGISGGFVPAQVGQARSAIQEARCRISVEAAIASCVDQRAGKSVNQQVARSAVDSLGVNADRTVAAEYALKKNGYIG